MNIGDRLELKALRTELNELKQHKKERELLTENLMSCVNDLMRRITDLEAKKPGRPKKDT